MLVRCMALCPLFVQLSCLSPPVSLPPPSIVLLLLLSLRRANVKTIAKETNWNALYNFLDKFNLDALLGHSFLNMVTVFWINTWFFYVCTILITTVIKLGGPLHLFMMSTSSSLLDWSRPPPPHSCQVTPFHKQWMIPNMELKIALPLLFLTEDSWKWRFQQFCVVTISSLKLCLKQRQKINILALP